MNLTTEQLKSIEDLAYRLITPQLIAVNIEADEVDLLQDIRTPGTKAHEAYYKGLLMQMVETREAIIKAAHNGSNPAQLELLKFMQEVQHHLRYE